MQLFVIRHAAAVERAPGFPDAARPLTTEGRRRFERAVRGLHRLDVRFDRLLHSPWLRAVETAEALVDLVHGETMVTRELAARPTSRLLGQLEGDRVALVGHQPWLGELLGVLLYGDAAKGTHFELKKGSVAWLDGAPRARGMKLRAILPPRVLRRLGH